MTHTHRLTFRCAEDLARTASARARKSHMTVPEYLRDLVRRDGVAR